MKPSRVKWFNEQLDKGCARHSGSAVPFSRAGKGEVRRGGSTETNFIPMSVALRRRNSKDLPHTVEKKGGK